MSVLTDTSTQRYADALAAMPESGGGGLHTYLMKPANLGVRAGYSDSELYRDIRQRIRGPRPVPDSEIWAAIRKARSSAITSPTPRPRPVIRGDAALQAIIRAGDGAGEADLWQASPVRIDWTADRDSWAVLAYLYRDDEILFIGDDNTPGTAQTVRTVKHWKSRFERVASPYPKIIPNPLTGEYGLTKSGNKSLRADSCIAEHRYVICEFDHLPLADQFAFWFGAKLPIAAITHSGSKSLHAWVRVDCRDADEWEIEIEKRLFPQILQPMGIDGACKNEARLSRMPGHLRKVEGKDRRQKLLYLNPDGGPVHAQ